jgi:hypothetical protein
MAADAPKIAHASGLGSKVHTPSNVPTDLNIIYSNLGSPTNTYSDLDGWLVAGPSSELGASQFIALPFTPFKDATVTQINVAVGYDGSGANQFILSLNSDNNGTPGNVIAQTTIKNAPTFGDCCKLSKWTLSKGEAVTAGTQYWVVASTPTSGTGDDFYGAWAFSVKDTFDYYTSSSGAWNNNLSFTGIPAGGVFGTVGK